MPRFVGGHSLRDVPAPSRTSRKSKAKQQEYESYLAVLKENEVGDLELDEIDNPRSVKVSLRRAAARVGIEIDVWDAGNHVYFRKGSSGKKRRPRSMLEVRRHSSLNGNEEEEIDLFGKDEEDKNDATS